MRRLMAMVANRRVDLSPLITHHFALDDIHQAYDLFSSQRDGVLKVALKAAVVPAAKKPELAGVGADTEC
jgi:threonine dehydrogenase-like Zn-dependent dehydrogenase